MGGGDAGSERGGFWTYFKPTRFVARLDSVQLNSCVPQHDGETLPSETLPVLSESPALSK